MRTHHPSPVLTSCLFPWRLLGWARGGRSSQTLRVHLRSEDALLNRLSNALPTSPLMSRTQSRSRAAVRCPESLVSFHLEHSQRLSFQTLMLLKKAPCLHSSSPPGLLGQRNPQFLPETQGPAQPRSSLCGHTGSEPIDGTIAAEGVRTMGSRSGRGGVQGSRLSVPQVSAVGPLAHRLSVDGNPSRCAAPGSPWSLDSRLR